MALVPVSPEGIILPPNSNYYNHGQMIYFGGSMHAPRSSYAHDALNSSMNGLLYEGNGAARRAKGRLPSTDKQLQNRPERRGGPHIDDKVKRTIYISNIEPSQTEAQIASFFEPCGHISDVRMCGDTGNGVKFAFIEFTDCSTVGVALGLNGATFSGLPLKVLQSKTAILPVSKDLMPRSNDDMERCRRTVYVANVDKRIDKEDIHHFFESTCGFISNMRLLGDNAHATRIAFIEFHSSKGAQAALNCSGAVLGSLALRISPSKTPLRPDPSVTTKDESTLSEFPNPNGVQKDEEEQGPNS